MSDTQFYLYAALLVGSGLMLLALAGIGFGQSAGVRVLNALFGLGFTGYGGYLLLLFEGGEVRIFLYAFIVPVVMIVSAVRNYLARRPAGDPAPAPQAPATS